MKVMIMMKIAKTIMKKINDENEMKVMMKLLKMIILMKW